MSAKLTKIFLLFAAAFCASCIRGENEDCGIYLKFIYDHNMEYVDSFDPQVGSVDVYLFDKAGKLLLTKRAETAQLVDRRMMFLAENLPLTTYRIVTVGGLCDKFRVGDHEGSSCSPGVTSLDQLRVSLERESDIVSHEFPHLWVGQTVDVNYEADLSVIPVRLVKNTNRFNLSLTRLGDGTRAGGEPVSYTFEIVTPEGAVYACDNSPVEMSPVTYTPYQLTQGDAQGNPCMGNVNTCRLLDREDCGYRLIVRNSSTLKPLWNHDLMDLLSQTKPTAKPNGDPLPMQEYLDRQSEWNIVILHKGGGDDEIHDMFTALGVRVNGWIIWFNDMGV